MAVKHKILKNGKGETKVVSLTARRAIIEHCKECLGWETNPRECTSPLCALFPFRTWDTPKSTLEI
jgi:hypothetical protein